MSAAPSYAQPVAVGETMEGEAIAEVVQSRDADYHERDLVRSKVGWCTHAIVDTRHVSRIQPGAVPITAYLGVLGMPGFTAYAGLEVTGQPKPGETLVVSAAAGPVGSLVGRLAKLAGARAVGIAGGAMRCRYLMTTVGFDSAVVTGRIRHRERYRESRRTSLQGSILDIDKPDHDQVKQAKRDQAESMSEREAVELVNDKGPEHEHCDRIGPELAFEQRAHQADLDDTMDQQIDRGEMLTRR
jgi:NADPH:quinone reductase-like Zn-dependent oxidoreductase